MQDFLSRLLLRNRDYFFYWYHVLHINLRILCYLCLRKQIPSHNPNPLTVLIIPFFFKEIRLSNENKKELMDRETEALQTTVLNYLEQNG